MISEHDLQLHIKVENSRSFRRAIFIKFGMKVEDLCIYGFLKNKTKNSKSRSRDTSIHMFFFKENNKQKT